MKFEFLWHDKIFSRRNVQALERLKNSYLRHWEGGSDNYSVQTLYLYEHVAEFYNLLEKRYIDRILFDIWFILDRKWAFSIWDQDFFHGHICGKSRDAIADLNEVLAPSNVCFLYHTFEEQAWIPAAINRNILSVPDRDPEVVHPNYDFGAQPGYGVSSKDLGLMEYARFKFKETPLGPYVLKNEKRLDIWGIFP